MNRNKLPYCTVTRKLCWERTAFY